MYTNTGSDPSGFAQQYVNSTIAGIASGFGAGPQPPGLDDLTTQSANAAVMVGLRGNVQNTFTIGADAGPNCSRAPTDAEIAPMVPNIPLIAGYTNNVMRLAYQAICQFSSAVQLDFEVIPSFDPSVPPITILTYSTVLAPSLQPNDIVVGINSANPGWGTSLGNNSGTNHSEVKNGANVQQFLDQTIKLR
jgi:triacylglycerol lipase